ncbi:putative flavonol 3-O-glucosyltransferase [Rosa chinensis]|uniref:Putative flavonol 3-O-glucosyltransferase n=1 Tax=Rosa chinensis TaxID=74649 RepID=A0A2P6QQX5_ROSCH|nr:putative flavonol 3-O-glucosyltransferase [Rosa chinensis]
MSHKVASTSPQNVAVLVFPFTSHPAALLRLLRSISTVCPDMQFTFFNISRSNSSLFSGSGNKGCANIKPYNVWDGLPDGYIPLSGNPLREHLELFIDNAPRIFERAIKEVEAETGHKFGCLISDALFWFAGDIAEKMHVAWVTSWIGEIRSLFVHIETDLIRDEVGAPGQENKTLEFLPGFSDEFRASDLTKEIVFGEIESPLARMLHKMGQKLPQAAAVVVNSFETMDVEVTEELKKRLQKLVLVGPLHLVMPVQSIVSNDEEEKDGCLQWLDKHEPASVAYVSFGTMVALPPMEVAALAEALEEGGFPFLWSFRGNQEDFPQRFIERTNGLSIGKVVPWVNQEKILNHTSVGVHVTHCG